MESEKAVENSLKWLAKVQEPEGFWDADKHGGGLQQKDPQGNLRKGGGRLADSGVTGLALLAFMGAGYTPTDGEYSDNVERALKWLIQQQRDDGYLGGSAISYDQMYCHAIATFALAEACGMQDESDRPPELRRAVRSAVDYIVDRQCADGGWRYEKISDGDMSMFGWQLMALKSADIAGIKVKPEVWTGMIAFLKKRSLGEHDGLAGYNASSPKPTPAFYRSAAEHGHLNVTANCSRQAALPASGSRPLSNIAGSTSRFHARTGRSLAISKAPSNCLKKDKKYTVWPSGISSSVPIIRRTMLPAI